MLFFLCLISIDSIAQEQCCRSKLNEEYCLEGISAANLHGECDLEEEKNSTCEAESFKVRSPNLL